MSKCSPIDRLLLLTKAPKGLQALMEVASRLSPGAVVVILCNGAMALHEEILRMSIFQNCHVICGLTTHGAWSKADFHVVHAGLGHTAFGRYGSRIPDESYQSTLQQLRSANLGGTDDLHIERSLWLKLAANASINPITALLEAPNSCILEEAQMSRCKAVCKEVAAVADAIWEVQGFEKPTCPSVDEMIAFSLETARQTSKNRSSMLQDMMAERPSEIDYINGWVAAKALELGISAPENAQLTALIKRKESEWCKTKELLQRWRGYSGLKNLTDQRRLQVCPLLTGSICASGFGSLFLPFLMFSCWVVKNRAQSILNSYREA